MEVAKEVEKDLFTALSKDILGVHAVSQGGTRKHPVVYETDIHIPAWFIVGGAVALWLIGLGVEPFQTTDANGNKRTGLRWTPRPRMVLPFTSSQSLSVPPIGPVWNWLTPPDLQGTIEGDISQGIFGTLLGPTLGHGLGLP